MPPVAGRHLKSLFLLPYVTPARVPTCKHRGIAGLLFDPCAPGSQMLESSFRIVVSLFLSPPAIWSVVRTPLYLAWTIRTVAWPDFQDNGQGLTKYLDRIARVAPLFPECGWTGDKNYWAPMCEWKAISASAACIRASSASDGAAPSGWTLEPFLQSGGDIVIYSLYLMSRGGQL